MDGEAWRPRAEGRVAPTMDGEARRPRADGRVAPTMDITVALLVAAFSCTGGGRATPSACAGLPQGTTMLDALPTGTCQGPADCDLLVREPCPCGPGPVDQYRCSCPAGEWHCVEIKGTGLCSCPEPQRDAGACELAFAPPGFAEAG